MNHRSFLRTTRHRSFREGFTVVELLVVIAIIGALVAVSIPAIQQARESSRKAACQNNLRQVGAALQNYHGQFGRLPKDGTRGWGVQVFLLPQLEQGTLHDELNPANEDLLPGSVANSQTTGMVLPVFLCPSFAGEPHVAGGFGRANSLGNSDLFSERNSLSDVYDGESQTMAMGETVNPHAWALPGLGTCQQPPNQGGEFGSQHSGGANILLCDGAVRFVSETVDRDLFQALGTIAGRETIGEF